MSTVTAKYKINESKVISETLEGETIMINLENGNYYSLNETASQIWDMLSAGHGVEAILGSVVARYHVTVEEAEKATATLLDMFTQDGLVFVVGTQEHSEVVAEAKADRLPFITPKAERYEDMQQMLLSDPIHDVDMQGWPILKKS